MDYLQQLIERYSPLASLQNNIAAAYSLLIDAFERGGKLLVAGNGGSASDAEHIVGELMKSFVKKRCIAAELTEKLKKLDREAGIWLGSHLQGTLPAIALTGHNSLNTACINDIDGKIIFAQQVLGYGRKGDVFTGISTSGNAKNIYYALLTAKAIGIKTIGLTGGNGGLLAKHADITIIVPETETYKIQELHLPIYHTLCLMIEDHFYEL
ncbi:MAG: SIS domain-containing protein [Treponema sp.]|jgi:D-sedoheptulose 7-phosphate isomerase|nr:SIS domain-containing protein [Treponema sp.]